MHFTDKTITQEGEDKTVTVPISHVDMVVANWTELKLEVVTIGKFNWTLNFQDRWNLEMAYNELKDILERHNEVVPAPPNPGDPLHAG